MEFLFRVSGLLQMLPITDVFKIAQQNNAVEIYKIVDNVEILVNNQILINTKFICHRINTIPELLNVPEDFGVEFDVRDYASNLILSHDPFNTNLNSESLDNYLAHIGPRFMMINVKSERVEPQILELLGSNTNYAFLDSTLPMMHVLSTKYKINNIVARFSEYEPLEYCVALKNVSDWIWVDCITKFSLDESTYCELQKLNKKICIVSPELHGRQSDISNVRNILMQRNIIPDAICCKIYNIIHWI